MNRDTDYKCKQCNWTGLAIALEYDTIDTCMGDDKIEMCPKCGSYEVKAINYFNTTEIEKKKY